MLVFGHRVDPRSEGAGSFATNPIIVAVEVRTVARISPVYGGGASVPSLSAVCVCSAATRLLWSFARRSTPMAVIVSGLSIVVTALGIEAAAVSSHWWRRSAGCQQQKNCGAKNVTQFHIVAPGGERSGIGWRPSRVKWFKKLFTNRSPRTSGGACRQSICGRLRTLSASAPA